MSPTPTMKSSEWWRRRRFDDDEFFRLQIASSMTSTFSFSASAHNRKSSNQSCTATACDTQKRLQQVDSFNRWAKRGNEGERDVCESVHNRKSFTRRRCRVRPWTWSRFCRSVDVDYAFGWFLIDSTSSNLDMAEEFTQLKQKWSSQQQQQVYIPIRYISTQIKIFFLARDCASAPSRSRSAIRPGFTIFVVNWISGFSCFIKYLRFIQRDRMKARLRLKPKKLFLNRLETQ